jgi:hypothetical protein
MARVVGRQLGLRPALQIDAAEPGLDAARPTGAPVPPVGPGPRGQGGTAEQGCDQQQNDRKPWNSLSVTADQWFHDLPPTLPTIGKNFADEKKPILSGRREACQWAEGLIPQGQADPTRRSDMSFFQITL